MWLLIKGESNFFGWSCSRALRRLREMGILGGSDCMQSVLEFNVIGYVG